MLTEKALALYRQVEKACAVASREPDCRAMAETGLAGHWRRGAVFCQEYRRTETRPSSAAHCQQQRGSGREDGHDARAVARLCKQGDMVQFHEYQRSEFAGVLGDSVRDQLTWIQARFAGRPAPSNCH